MKTDVNLEELLHRVEVLERAVLGDAKLKKAKSNGPKTEENFSGATGGVRFLFSKGFFEFRQSFSAVQKELQENGYHYRKQAVQNALTRLSVRGGPLVTLKDGGRNSYVRRK